MTSLYIHIPFCLKRCAFCSFVVTIGREHLIDDYLESLAFEAGRYKGTTLRTLYIGGGTPTHINFKQLESLIKLIRDNFSFTKTIEWTIEANPEDIDLEKAKLLKSCGVNRLSLGVQSLHDRYLKFLGRAHTSAKAILAFKDLRKAGFDNLSLDFMFSFPKQSLGEIEEDLSKMTALNSEHLSLYTLTIEEGTKFSKTNVVLDNDESRAEQYVHVAEFLERKNFKQYEISNFAKPKFESKHNQNYWQGGDYIGLGIGAHSHNKGRRFWNTSNLAEYLQRTKSNQTIIEGEENLEKEKQFLETFLFGLRTNEGIDVARLQKRFDYFLPKDKHMMIEEWVKERFFIREDEKLKTTMKGKLILDELSSRLI